MSVENGENEWAFVWWWLQWRTSCAKVRSRPLHRLARRVLPSGGTGRTHTQRGRRRRTTGDRGPGLPGTRAADVFGRRSIVSPRAIKATSSCRARRQRREGRLGCCAVRLCGPAELHCRLVRGLGRPALPPSFVRGWTDRGDRPSSRRIAEYRRARSAVSYVGHPSGSTAVSL